MIINDVVRMNDDELDSVRGVGLVRSLQHATCESTNQVCEIWKVDFQSGESVLLTDKEVVVIGQYEVVWSHCQSIVGNKRGDDFRPALVDNARKVANFLMKTHHA